MYIWNKYYDEEAKLNKEKNESLEKFIPFAPDMTIPTNTLFLPLNAQNIFMHKYMLLGMNRALKCVILVTNLKGAIRVFHNTRNLDEESY